MAVEGTRFAGPVYIVDDDEAVRDSLQILLLSEGIDAETFASGADFLDGVAGRPWGPVVLDLHMPAIGGFDVLAALKALACALPVIMVSGRFDEAARQRALAAGVAAILEKPLDADALMQLLSRLG
jgi:two-component system response regulator FixJ